jgi:hypothetical protein
VFFFKFYFCCASTLYSFLVGLKPLIPVIFLLQREVEEGRKGFQLAQTCSVAVQVVSAVLFVILSSTSMESFSYGLCDNL